MTNSLHHALLKKIEEALKSASSLEEAKHLIIELAQGNAPAPPEKIELHSSAAQIEDMPASSPDLLSKYRTYFETLLYAPMEQLAQTSGIHLSSREERYTRPIHSLLYIPLCAIEAANSVFISCIPEWEQELRGLLAGANTIDALHIIKSFVKKTKHIVDGYYRFYGLESLNLRIDASSAVLLDSCHYDQYYGFLKEKNPYLFEFAAPNDWMPKEYNSMVDKKVHFCAFESDKIVAATDSETIVGEPQGLINVAIHTLENHRRKGHAAAVCAAFIKHQLQQGLLPVWQCQLDNSASQSLAEKLGFRALGNVYFAYASVRFWEPEESSPRI